MGIPAALPHSCASSSVRKKRWEGSRSLSCSNISEATCRHRCWCSLLPVRVSLCLDVLLLRPAERQQKQNDDCEVRARVGAQRSLKVSETNCIGVWARSSCVLCAVFCPVSWCSDHSKEEAWSLYTVWFPFFSPSLKYCCLRGVLHMRGICSCD